MSPSSRPKNTSVIEHLTENPYVYSFIQAIRLLERSCYFESLSSNNSNKVYPVSGFSPPETEVIRFHTNQKLEFFSSELSEIKRNHNNINPKQWHILVNIMGLTGSMGVLPYHYTEMILQRLKLKDKTLLKFLDLFNHRTISLFSQASTKYRLPIEYERKKLNSDTETSKNSHTAALLSLIGLGTKYLNNRLYTQDESLLYYSGLLSHQIKTSVGLKQILERHFSIPVEIKEFIGQWQTLIDDVRTRLVSKMLPKGQNACLGRSALIGHKGWYAQGKVQIILGPLDKNQLQKFAPETKTLKALNELVRLYTGLECNYEFIIRVKRSDVPKKIILSKTKPAIIGWNTWLPSSTKQKDQNETVDIIVTLVDKYKNK